MTPIEQKTGQETEQKKIYVLDTPYLTTHTNGLSMAVTQFAHWPYAGYVTLKASER